MLFTLNGLVTYTYPEPCPERAQFTEPAVQSLTHCLPVHHVENKQFLPSSDLGA